MFGFVWFGLGFGLVFDWFGLVCLLLMVWDWFYLGFDHVYVFGVVLKVSSCRARDISELVNNYSYIRGAYK